MNNEFPFRHARAYSPVPNSIKEETSPENDLIPNPRWEARIHPGDKIRVLMKLQNVTDRFGRNWEDEYRFQKTDGSYVVIHDERAITYDYELCPIRMKGIPREISLAGPAKAPRLPEQKKMNRIPVEMIRNARGPLANILLAAESIETENLNEEQKEHIKIIVRGAKRINEFINKALIPYHNIH